MKSVGQKLRTAREALGISQSELAAMAGFAPSAISHFENDRREPTFDSLRRLIKHLCLTTDYLILDNPVDGKLVDIANAARALFEQKVSPIHRPPPPVKWVALAKALDL